MPGDNQFVEVGRLLSGESLQPKIVQYKQVRAEEGEEIFSVEPFLGNKIPGAPPYEIIKEFSKGNLKNRALHHHVFDTRLAVEMIHHIGLQILSVERINTLICVAAKKPRREQEVKNERFRGTDTPPIWRSSRSHVIRLPIISLAVCRNKQA